MAWGDVDPLIDWDHIKVVGDDEEHVEEEEVEEEDDNEESKKGDDEDDDEEGTLQVSKVRPREAISELLAELK